MISMILTDKFPGAWQVHKLLDGYKVVSADGRCLAIFSAQPTSNSTLTFEDAHDLAKAFARLGDAERPVDVPQKENKPPQRRRTLP